MGADINKACLYTAANKAETALTEILPAHRKAVIRYVILNKAFDYYDGMDFVYSLSKAKLYTFEEAAVQLRELR